MLDSHGLTMLGLGFVLGLQHALDTDHIVAVSTVLAERPSFRASGVVGLFWGLGHTLMLVLVGGSVLALHLSIPESLAAAFEVVWAVGLKYTNGFTRLWPSVATIGAMAVSMYLLALAARALPIGTAYAVWTGLGAVGTAVLGMMLFNEPANAGRLVCIALIVCGVAGLKVFSP